MNTISSIEPDQWAGWIEQRRRDLNLTQKAIAQVLEVSPYTIGAWETRGIVPMALTRAKVVDVLQEFEYSQQHGPRR
jgi:DNA-binding transcriptional regulator YiaG